MKTGKEWRKLGDFTKWKSGGTPSKGNPEFWDGVIPWISAKSLTTDFISDSDQKISEEGLLDGSRLANRGELLLLVRGSGLFKRIPVGYVESPVSFNQDIKSIQAVNGISTEFLFLWFKGNEHVISGILETTGIGAGKLDLERLKALPFRVPKSNEAEAIVDFGFALCRKIDLLKRQNKTLEGMAEALFRQWFIEEAQDDWEEYSASDFVEHIKESENPQSKPDTWFSHFSLPAFDDGKKPSMEKGEDIKSNKYVVQANSLLVSKLNPGTPRVWHCGSTLPQNPICSTEFQVIKPQAHLLGFFRCLYSSNEVVEFLSACASGTSGSHQRVKPKDIVNLAFHAPSHDSMIKFSSITADWFEKILENQEQILTLENERNTLLPKLMSGEVRVNLD